MRKIIGIFIIVIVLLLLYSVDGYNFVFKTLIYNNMEFIANNPTLSTSDKYSIKLGADYRWCMAFNEAYLGDRVWIHLNIIKDKQYRHLNNKAWCTYFIYPRQVVISE